MTFEQEMWMGKEYSLLGGGLLSSGQIMQDHAGSITQIVWRLCTPYLTVVGPIKIRLGAPGFCIALQCAVVEKITH